MADGIWPVAWHMAYGTAKGLCSVAWPMAQGPAAQPMADGLCPAAWPMAHSICWRQLRECVHRHPCERASVCASKRASVCAIVRASMRVRDRASERACVYAGASVRACVHTDDTLPRGRELLVHCVLHELCRELTFQSLIQDLVCCALLKGASVTLS